MTDPADAAPPPPATTDAWPDLSSLTAEGMKEQIMGRLAGGLAGRMGIEFDIVTPEQVTGRMPVVGNTQPMGLLHGGASAALAETLGSFGAALHAGPRRMALGIELNASHHRSASSGWVYGSAVAVSLGSTLAVYEVVITDEADRRVCTARLTCLLRDIRPT